MESCPNFVFFSPQLSFDAAEAFLVRVRRSLRLFLLSRQVGMQQGRVKQSGVAIIQQHRGAGSTVCPSPDLAAAAAIAANPRSSRQSRFPKYRLPAGQTLRNGKRNAHTRVKPLRYIRSKSGFRPSPLFWRCALAKLPAWPADKSPGPELEY